MNTKILFKVINYDILAQTEGYKSLQKTCTPSKNPMNPKNLK